MRGFDACKPGCIQRVQTRFEGPHQLECMVIGQGIGQLHHAFPHRNQPGPRLCGPAPKVHQALGSLDGQFGDVALEAAPVAARSAATGRVVRAVDEFDGQAAHNALRCVGRESTVLRSSRRAVSSASCVWRARRVALSLMRSASVRRAAPCGRACKSLRARSASRSSSAQRAPRICTPSRSSCSWAEPPAGARPRASCKWLSRLARSCSAWSSRPPPCSPAPSGAGRGALFRPLRPAFLP